MRKAMELMLTGNSMTGHDAVECGFANLSFPEEKLEEEVLKLQKMLLRYPKMFSKLIKELFIGKWR